MTDKQRQLLKDLSNMLLDLATECEKDDVFNSYIGGLEIFKKDLHESFYLLIEELEK